MWRRQPIATDCWRSNASSLPKGLVRRVLVRVIARPHSPGAGWPTFSTRHRDPAGPAQALPSSTEGLAASPRARSCPYGHTAATMPNMNSMAITVSAVLATVLAIT